MNKTNLKLMENWREKQSTVILPMNSINVEYETHLNALRKGLKYKSSNVSTYSDGREIPIVVKPNIDGEDCYILLFGLGQYCKIKELGKNNISAVVVEESRTGLVKSIRKNYQEYWGIGDIKIKKSYAESYPSLDKILSKAKMMMRGKIDPITIDYRSGYLVDGYITYLLLKFRGENKVKVILK